MNTELTIAKKGDADGAAREMSLVSDVLANKKTRVYIATSSYGSHPLVLAVASTYAEAEQEALGVIELIGRPTDIWAQTAYCNLRIRPKTAFLRTYGRKRGLNMVEDYYYKLARLLS